MKIKKAIITAGGWGTRFLPVTKRQPKEMLPVINKPLIHYSVEEAVACGVELVVIVTAVGKSAIEDYFDHYDELEQVLERNGQMELAGEIRRLTSMVDIAFVRQKQKLGLGHALLTAKKLIGDEPFLLLLPDDLFEDTVLEDMIGTYNRYGSNVIAVKRVSEAEVSRYGIVNPRKVGDRVFEVTDLVEKPKPAEAPSNLAIMGRYVIRPEIMQILEDTPPGKNGEIQLTDALRRLGRKQRIYAYEFEGERYDAGTPLGWLQTNVAMALKDPEMGPALQQYLSSLANVPWQSTDYLDMTKDSSVLR